MIKTVLIKVFLSSYTSLGFYCFLQLIKNNLKGGGVNNRNNESYPPPNCNNRVNL